MTFVIVFLPDFFGMEKEKHKEELQEIVRYDVPDLHP